MCLRYFHDNGVFSCLNVELKHVLKGSAMCKNNTAVLTVEANSFINGTHFGRVDAIKATYVVSIDDDMTRLYMTV
jgi:hypothetical protein